MSLRAATTSKRHSMTRLMRRTLYTPHLELDHIITGLPVDDMPHVSRLVICDRACNEIHTALPVKSSTENRHHCTRKRDGAMDGPESSGIVQRIPRSARRSPTCRPLSLGRATGKPNGLGRARTPWARTEPRPSDRRPIHRTSDRPVHGGALR
jgi:hypothetical protein